MTNAGVNKKIISAVSPLRTNCHIDTYTYNGPTYRGIMVPPRPQTTQKEYVVKPGTLLLNIRYLVWHKEGPLFKKRWCMYARTNGITVSWWRRPMATFSALLAICAGNSPVTGEFPAQRPLTQSFVVFFELRLNKRLSTQSWRWWFETPSRPLWRHCHAPISLA